MSQLVFLGVAVVAGLGCPLHMWRSHCRGRQAARCPSVRNPALQGELEKQLWARQERLRALIAACGPGAASADADGAPVDAR